MEIVHWTEHVVKTRGAPYLRSPALLLSWYQKLFLDYAVLLVLAMLVLIMMIKKVQNVLFAKKMVENKKRK